MTNEEIIEAEKLLAEINNDLADIAAATEIETIITLVLEKGPGMIDCFQQLARYRPRVFESVSDCEAVEMGVAALMAVAEMAKRGPENKTRLTAPVLILRLCSSLNKAARTVKELKNAGDNPDA